MKYSNTLAGIRCAPGSPPRLPVHRHMRQEPWRTDEPAWLGSFFSLQFGDYTGQWLLSLPKKPLAGRLHKAVCPDVVATPGPPLGLCPRSFLFYSATRRAGEMCHGPCALLPIIFQISFGKVVIRKIFCLPREAIHVTSNKDNG